MLGVVQLPQLAIEVVIPMYSLVFESAPFVQAIGLSVINDDPHYLPITSSLSVQLFTLVHLYSNDS